MKKSMISILFLSFGILLVTSQFAAQATKEDISGYMTFDSMIEFGEAWVSDGILHRRGGLYKWQTHSTDSRMVGFIFDGFNGNIFLNNPTFNGKIWGKFWIELDGGGTWDGSWNGEIVNGLQQGAGVAHGTGGIIDGMKLKMEFWQDPNIGGLIHFEGMILNPGGN